MVEGGARLADLLEAVYRMERAAVSLVDESTLINTLRHCTGPLVPGLSNVSITKSLINPAT